MDKFEQTVLKEIQGHRMIKPSAKVLIALSGGADSVCLFRVLLTLKQELKVTFSAVHVNHMLRMTADRDEAFVTELCEKYRVPLIKQRVDVSDYAKRNGLGTEEAARILRYEVFEKVRRQTGADVVALAHHMNDQAETVLFHVCRGCGIEGLRGIRPVREHLIRPLLGVRRDEIEDYLASMHQEYVTDETNRDTKYNRNLLRNEILPQLTGQICQQTTEHIAQLAQQMAQLEDYLGSQLETACADCVTCLRGEQRISIPKIQGYHSYLQTMLVKKCLCEMSRTNKDIARVHVTDVLSLCQKQSGKSVDLPYEVKAVREYDEIVLRKECGLPPKGALKTAETVLIGAHEEINFEKTVLLEDGRSLSLKIFERPSDANIPTKTYTKWFDYAKIKKPVILRTPQQKDYFFFDKTHKKYIRDYMKDEKIPAAERSGMPLVACEDHVLYFIGGRMSTAFQVTGETATILEIVVSE